MEADEVLFVLVVKQEKNKFLLFSLSSCKRILRVCLSVFVTADQRIL